MSDDEFEMMSLPKDSFLPVGTFVGNYEPLPDLSETQEIDRNSEKLKKTVGSEKLEKTVESIEKGKEIFFIYIDAKSKITKRKVYIDEISDNHIQGRCAEAKALRIFRKDRILEIFNVQEEMDGKLSYYQSQDITPPEKKTSIPMSQGVIDICFTGFDADTKRRLTELAKEKEITIRVGVTKDLSFLCCGKSPGPVKLKKAREVGAIILSGKELITLFETGEAPLDEENI